MIKLDLDVDNYLPTVYDVEYTGNGDGFPSPRSFQYPDVADGEMQAIVLTRILAEPGI